MIGGVMKSIYLIFGFLFLKIIEKAGIIESTRAVATMLTASLTTDSDEEGTKKNEE